jgi:catechol 2,3-dioxygenase-like lactoylglutathione lyase family enzyme
MRAKIFFITLAVDDLDRAVAFYRDGLGWPTEGIVGREFHDELTGADGTIAIVTLDDGLLLTLYERTNLAQDASLPAGPPSSTEFSLGIPARRGRRSTGCSRRSKPLAVR